MALSSAGRAARLREGGDDVGKGEIAPYEEKRAVALLGEDIGESVAEIERGAMQTAAISCVSLTRGSGEVCIDSDDLKRHIRQKGLERLCDARARRDDVGLGQRARRNDKSFIGGQSRGTCRPLLLIVENCENRRCVDDDHAGRPSSS